jgi:hypothetical protein
MSAIKLSIALVTHNRPKWLYRIKYAFWMETRITFGKQASLMVNSQLSKKQ